MNILHFAAVTALLFSLSLPVFGKEPPPVSNPQVDKLVAVLKSNAPQKDKADACRELARIGTRDAVPALAALLADEKLSHMARYGLETIPDPTVDEAFLKALTRLEGSPLVGVIGSVGVRRDAKAVPLLANLLKNRDVQVIEAAGRALGSIANDPAAKALTDALTYVPLDNQPAIYEGLFRCAESFAAKGYRSQALAIYDRLRSNQTRHQIRAGALRGAILNRKDGLPLLLQVLHSPDYSLFAAAAHTSLEMPGGRVTSTLAAELDTLPIEHQVLLIQVIGKRADSRALAALSAAAKHGPQPVRIAALRALCELDDSSTTPLLLDLLGDADRQVAHQAQETLASLQGLAVDEAVLALLESPQTNRSLPGMELAARRRMASALAPLFKLASRGEPSTRLVAVRKLAELAPASELGAFFELLEKAQTPADLEGAEQALSSVCVKAGDAGQCSDAIAMHFAQSQPEQRCALLNVLGAVGGPKALKQVQAALVETNDAVHAAAIRVLGSWNNPEAAGALLELAQSASSPTDKTLCLRSYLSLASHPDFPAEQRLAMCRQAAGLAQNPDEKKQLLAALGNLSSPEALELIKPHFEDTATKEEAASAAVNVSERILQGNEASRLAAQLTEPLENAAQITSNNDLAERARKLAQQARTKQAGK